MNRTPVFSLSLFLDPAIEKKTIRWNGRMSGWTDGFVFQVILNEITQSL